MKIFDGSRIISGWNNSPVTSAEWCPFCITKEEAGEKGPIPVGPDGTCLRCGARHYRPILDPTACWERDIQGEIEMLKSEIEHRKSILEAEKALQETTETFLELEKQKVKGRNIIIKRLRASLKKTYAPQAQKPER